jgi:uncharacterized protein
MTGGAAIFVKTPGRSPVKTRLATGLGTGPAKAWYELAAAAVAAVATRVAGLTAYWAIAEEPADEPPCWRGLPVLQQGEGELGARMARVHAALLARHDYALLLGADTPQLDPAVISAAAEWLSSSAPRVVMGPARDGGFWLLGANRQPPLADWLGTACGRADTARGFLAAMAPHGSWRLLEELTDVDRADDLAPMLAELARLAAPLPEQQRMADWTRAALRVR